MLRSVVTSDGDVAVIYRSSSVTGNMLLLRRSKYDVDFWGLY